MTSDYISGDDTKWQIVCDRLEIERSVLRYQALCEYLTNRISKAVGLKTYLNCISSRLICDVIQLLTGEQLTASNLCTYKQHGIDIVGVVAKKLSLPVVNGINCKVKLTENSELVISPTPGAPSQALRTLMEHRGISVRDILYQQWSANGDYQVGDKRNWPSPKLLNLLSQYPSLIVQAPVSHDTPVRHGRLLKYLGRTLSSLQPNAINQPALELIIHEFCLQDLKSPRQIRAWLPSVGFIKNIQYVEKLTSEIRQSPYFYIKNVYPHKIAKIGSADRSNQRVKADDLGVIIALNSRPENGDALRIESIVRRELAKCHIYPIDGKKDHYAMQLIELAALVLNILANKKSLHPLLNSITATCLPRQ
ncbi:hypothetical protein [Shewanella xiamenensis]|uniref:hypothetical protein n=1 Tax=Shewanella xiamenensis TaxID=332186 RepID=UPI0021C0B1EF|nr:hypothetical protein [Shewanella xiamenensis]MCT8869583.1 hypothetical protein [Shewanella xiamenensis]